MFKLLGGLKQYFKWQDIQTDNIVFRLHNTFTTALLLACSLMITATQYVGNPISCIVGGVPSHVVNTFCWISSTFTMPDAFRRQVGREVAHPGIANDFDDEDAKKYYTYYQWVCFVLFFQAIACYTPKFIWDAVEGGLMRMIVMGLNIGACKEQEKCAKKQVLLDYLLGHLKHHKIYVVRYWVCEALCFINIVVQLWLMNQFFNGEFLSYGWDVLQYSDQPQEQRADPMVYVFPRVTKCNFYKYGPTGSIQKHDAMCILPLNIVNEKTYIFIWFWYIILATLLAGLIIYRAIIIFVPSVRARLLNARNRMVPRDVAKTISDNMDLGDWWIVYMLATNLDPLIYRDIVTELSKRIKLNEPSESEEKRMH
ncbi:innexin inx1 [Anopheles cruzii]|uniref:innexin inx1 n=1 Tax=Anopheles cruzii TaxID=68878 RepID=UPI0022EC6D2E|nr:innexin inx1 [Anopheles cruzii]XP_052867901.1 innexin inx1 [Anopheles cruzii]